MAGATGLEPATSAVTGQRSNQLSYAPAGVGQDLKAALPQVKDNRVTRPTLREVPYFPQESLVKPVPNRLFGQKRSGVRPGSRISRGGSHHGYGSW